jgi:hypothetical protein
MKQTYKYLMIGGAVALGSIGIINYQGQQQEGQVLSDQTSIAKMKKSEGGKLNSKNLQPVKANADSPDGIINQILKDSNDEDMAAKPTDGELAPFTEDSDEINALGEDVHE